jgi:flavin reductase (DIM6/NTAB) family NADH-FMN oxidoreductase RutF
MAANHSPDDPVGLRLAMRQWASGITVVTVDYQGVQHGMTVSSFTSISLSPPTVLVSLERVTRTHDLVMQSGSFGITIISSRQKEIADRFAGLETEEQNRFAGLETHTLVSGAPFLVGGLSYFDCRVLATHQVGTHTLVIGEVLAVKVENGGRPLIYYNRRYHQLQD